MSDATRALLTPDEEIVDILRRVRDLESRGLVLGAWKVWTPTLANLNVGTTGTVAAAYLYAMGRVDFDIHVNLGGTGISVGDCTFSVPVPEAGGYSSGVDDRVVVGEAALMDAATLAYHGVVTIDDGLLRPRALNASATFVAQNSLSSTIPHPWAAGDRMYLHGWYRTQ